MTITKTELYQKLREIKCFQPGSSDVGSERMLAKRLGLNKETVFRFFLGKTNGMKFGTIILICSALRISCAELPIEVD